MRLHSRQPHISPDLQTSHSPLPISARRASTPLANSSMTQAAEHIAHPSTRAAIPLGLESRLLNALSTNTHWTATLKKTLGLRPTTSNAHQEEKQRVAQTINQAIIQTFDQKPSKKELRQHTLSLINASQADTPRVKKYIQQALPEAMQWLKEHDHILSPLPEQAQRKLTEWAKSCFQHAQPWALAKQQLNLNMTVKNAMITRNPLLQEHAPFIEQTLQNTFKQAPPYRLYYQHPRLDFVSITTEEQPQTPFYGGYFKAHKKSGHPILPNTRVRTLSGHVYELMNRLNPRDAQQLKQQHGLNFAQDKVVLGRGAYGKVRLARNVSTGEFVAVKKFLWKERAPFVYANREASRLTEVQEAAKSNPLGSSPLLLDTMLDVAHVSIQTINSNNLKSYLFTPLANRGDGSAMRDRLAADRNMGNSAAAQALFLNLAKQYTQAVSELHQLGFHHRDIKLKNFLNQGSQNNIKARLADFGVMQDKGFVNNYAGGTLTHLPPEAIRTNTSNLSPYAYHAEKHDLFSLGLSLLELKLGKDPKQHTSAPHLELRYEDDLLKAVTLNFDGVTLACAGVADELLQHLVPDHIDNQIALLLATNPSLRPSAQQVQAVLSKELR